MRILSLLSIFSSAISAATDWRVLNGGIMYKNSTFLIKGSNYFGLETCDFVPHGLWAHPLTWYLDFLHNNSFNLLRIPFSEQWVIDGFHTYAPRPDMISADPSLQGLKSYEILDKLLDEAYARGMFVVLDLHRLNCRDQSHELWYSLTDGKYTTDTFFQAWEKVINRYKEHPALHAIDLLNEPRGLATWGNDSRTSWNMFVEYAFKTMRYYRGLVYINGVNWGRDFEGWIDHPIVDVPETRIVYSPHTYGPSIAAVASMDPVDLHADWTRAFGFLVSTGKVVVISEFGGRYTGADRVWQDLYVDYLIALRVPGIVWTLNPTSIDTGGLLQDDWTSPVVEKLELMQRLQPFPTVIRHQKTNKHIRAKQ